MHFKYDNHIYNTKYVKEILHGRESVSEDHVYVIFFFDLEDTAALQFHCDYDELSEFFFQWKYGREFFEFEVNREHEKDELDLG